MKKVKFVTAFYAYHNFHPYWGKQGIYDRYKYSLITLCNMKEEIVCYTDEGDMGYNQLISIKEEYNLDNLIIKVSKIEDNPYQKRVYKIRTEENPERYNNPHIANFTRPTQIYWMKFNFMLNEFEPNINLYWIDVGLSHGGLFPWFLNPYSNEEDYKNGFTNTNQSREEIAQKLHTFTHAFNEDTVKKIIEFTEDKFVSISRLGSTDCQLDVFQKALGETIDTSDSIFPVGGFFGGNSNLIQTIFSDLKVITDTLLENNFLCTDEELLTYFQSKHKDLYKIWICDTFYHEGQPDVWNANMIPFHRFFSEK